MYTRNVSPMQRAMSRVGAVPRGAQHGAMAGQMPAQAMQMRQPGGGNPQAYSARRGMPAPQMNPAQMQQMQQMMRPGLQQQLAVPQGADAGALAGCGDGYGGCLSMPYGLPWAGFPNQACPWVQFSALIPIRATFPDPAENLTLQISCGNSLFYGCCARSFNGPNEVGIASIFSGSDDTDLLCPGSGSLDINYFNTNGNECCCPFDFGCFSSFFPLIIEFEAFGAPSVSPLVNMVIGGERLSGGDACSFWPGLVPSSFAWPGSAPCPLPGGYGGYPGLPGGPVV